MERHRPLLTGHCYRMLGSVFDADDAVQETLVRAWRSRENFEGRSALASWLYRIATNVCLDLLTERKRRARPVEERPAGTIGEPLMTRPSEEWLEPIPDGDVVPAEADPHVAAVLRQSTRLAFVSALQRLTGKQRAALLLVDVLDFSAKEAAECLKLSIPAVNSALQRARSCVGEGALSSVDSLTNEQTALVARYVEAFEAFDIDRLVTLLHRDAHLSMPPYSFWVKGPTDIHRWLVGPGAGCRGSRLLATSACGLPAFGQYRQDASGGYKPWALIVLELDGDRINGINNYLDSEKLFPRFGLPMHLE